MDLTPTNLHIRQFKYETETETLQQNMASSKIAGLLWWTLIFALLLPFTFPDDKIEEKDPPTIGCYLHKIQKYMIHKLTWPKAT